LDARTFVDLFVKVEKPVPVTTTGRIIKAYNAFEYFLDSDKSWDNYKKILFDAYPERVPFTINI
jgi:hypothetical protein